MPRRIRDRVNGSFDTSDREQISKYIDWLRPVKAEYMQGIRRMATAMVLLAAAFELVANSRSAEISIGSFRVDRGSIVLEFLPAIVAYFFLQINIDTNRVSQVDKIFQATFKLWSEKAWSNDLHLALQESAPVYWSMLGGTSRPENTYASDKLEDKVSYALLFVVTGGTLLFEAQAYFTLFPKRASEIVLWAISLLLTIFLISFAMRMLVADFDAPASAGRDETPMQDNNTKEQ